MFGAILGVILLGEQLMLHGWSGVGLLVTGIVFVALDPGTKTEEGGGGELTGEGPPVYWIAIALVCASAYAFYNIFIKKGSSSINPILGGKLLRILKAVPQYSNTMHIYFFSLASCLYYFFQVLCCSL